MIKASLHRVIYKPPDEETRPPDEETRPPDEETRPPARPRSVV